MNFRSLGSTGLDVSEIGLGSNRLGEKIESDEHWDRLTLRAIELGVNIFDTAEAYGSGRSEEVLGRVVGERSDVIIASKYSPQRNGSVVDFTYATISESVEASLKRLQRSVIDVYQIHSPKLEELKNREWVGPLNQLKSEGKIKHVAIVVNSAEDGIWLIENDLAEVLQITYNLIDRRVEEILLPLAQEKGVGLLVRKPLSRGVLTGKFLPGQAIASHHRATHDKEALSGRIDEAEKYKPLGAEYPGGLTRLAHHFSLSHQAVSCIIPGARSIKQLEENIDASDGFGLPYTIKQSIDILTN